VSFGARALIRLGAIRHNFKTIKDRAPGARVMAVIKANAYGHGLLAVARTLAEADCLAVARLGEAAELREAGIDTPIALLGGVLSEDDLARALALKLQVAVHSKPQVEWLERLCQGDATVWLKIDTGMNRLGFRPDEAPDLIRRLRECAGIGRLGLMTHLSSADDKRDQTTVSQLQQFEEIVSGFDGDLSIANSPGIFAWDSNLSSLAARENRARWWVRPGLALYGVSPFAGECGEDLGLQSAMRFESRLIAVKILRQNDPVGYGGTWRPGRDTVLGIVAAGYGDGYSRFIPAGTPVVLNGRRVPVAGRVSMDLAAVDLGPGATDRIGDPVLLWGDELPVEEVAEHAGTIPYQLLCGVSNREAAEYLP